MKHKQRAIELAIEGGYPKDKTIHGQEKIYLDHLRRFGVVTALKMWEAYIFLDPLFWQSIGKSLGWVTNSEIYYYGRRNEEGNIITSGVPWDLWEYYWHSFIDALASGQTPDDFFATILPADK